MRINTVVHDKFNIRFEFNVADKNTIAILVNYLTYNGITSYMTTFDNTTFLIVWWRDNPKDNFINMLNALKPLSLFCRQSSAINTTLVTIANDFSLHSVMTLEIRMQILNL